MASSQAPVPLPRSPLDTIPTENWNLISDPKKPSKGRRKIAIKKIEDKNRKHVTFSKRRTGLFKKATELCVKCGASVAIVTFSEAGKCFTFGHPSTDAVIHRYLRGGASSTSSALAIGDPSEGIVDDRRPPPPFWWDRPVQDLGFEELESFAASLERIRSDVETRIADLDLEYYNSMKSQVDFDFYEQRLNQANMAPINYFNNGVSFGGVDPDAITFDQHYQYCGCGCMGAAAYDHDIAMANFNSFGPGFQEF